MDSNLKARVEKWIDDDVDEASRAEMREALARGDQAELTDRMAGPLEFGTAGLRGIIGAGPNRMNRAVIIRTTAGLAAYLKAHGRDAARRGVVIGYDGRRMSRQFAEETASVLAASGVVAHLFPTLCTTPQTAFATTELNAVASVMVTASHNPPEYNGYKVYWDNGAQIIPPHDKGIAKAIDQVGPARTTTRMPLSQAREKGLVRDVPAAVTEHYLKRIAALSIHSEAHDQLRIVYTPMHGVGNLTARAALAQAGFAHVTSVPQQAEPDGEFPTVRFPNPEEPGALDIATALARDLKADLILANDPDADRLAVAVPTADSQGWVQLTGNQVGVLMGHYLLADHPKPAADRLVIASIVSSPMLGDIAKQLGVRYEEVLTGFKWIANKAMEVEAATSTEFVFGYEEALGYTVGNVVRDKDGVGAAAIFAELTAYHRTQGRTVLQELERIYRRYGLYLSRQKSITRKGLDGATRISATMAQLRQNVPSTIGEFQVEAVRDYQLQQRKARDGKVSTLQLPVSNVLAFELSGGNRVIARPSGTEPKIKFYFDLREQVVAGEPFAQAEQRALGKLDALEEAFLKIVG